MLRYLALSVFFGLSACTVFPGAGPLADTVTSSANDVDASKSNYHLVPIDADVIARLNAAGGPSLNGSFGSKISPVQQLIAVGDKITISVFESAPGGLFGSATTGEINGARQVTLPTQFVDQSGFIEVPFAGRFRAVGTSPRTLGERIENALAARAIEPQVIVGLDGYSANTATVMGEVSKTGEIPLSPRGDRLLTVLANAGISASETEAVVRLVRGGRIQTVPLSTIINRPSENIYIAPGDTVFVLKKPQVFNAMGAVSDPGQYPISFSEQTVAGALSLAGGLSAQLANRGGVFLFRFEPEAVARKVLPQGTELKSTPSGVPVVYQLSFLDPNAFFWLQQMRIHDGDMIYVAHTITRELDNFAALVVRGRLFGL